MDYFAKRIIPCLDVDNGRVVKGVNFVGLRDAGDPVEVAYRYNEEGADEITFLDIGATHEGRDTIVNVRKFTDTSAHCQRDKHFFCHLFYHIYNGISSFMCRSDI